ncbi:MAG: dicarboxylate/amino acid:cation symporter [Coxiellaceae bacterium]|jgi:Na+/H+-dicarboxylate symporter|nr:dicarboxylate/amino acid:cation symporter [Coxiellaceae bacterium]
MKLNLWQKVLVGMLLGIICGYFFKEYYFIAKPFATIYMNMVKMIVVPTVFFAILYGLTHISDIHTLGRIGIKASIIYSFVTIFAVAIGITMALIFKPGIGVQLAGQGLNIPNITITETTLESIIVNMFPNNPISAMANGNTLQIVVFTIILGLALILTGPKADDAKRVISSSASVIFKMVELVVKITPIGVFVIMMWIVGQYGFALILSLGKLASVIIITFAIQHSLFGIILLIFGLNPFPFYSKTFNIQSIAFATSSSKATIATAISDLQEKAGVSKHVAGFILPLGAAVNMTGSAIYIAICALFFAQTASIELTHYQYVILIATSTIGSIGAAGYPSGAVIMLGMVLPAIGLPIEGIPLIMGIDRLLDMFRTVINVTGDCAVTVVVDKIEHTLDINKYQSKED